MIRTIFVLSTSSFEVILRIEACKPKFGVNRNPFELVITFGSELWFELPLIFYIHSNILGISNGGIRVLIWLHLPIGSSHCFCSFSFCFSCHFWAPTFAKLVVNYFFDVIQNSSSAPENLCMYVPYLLSSFFLLLHNFIISSSCFHTHAWLNVSTLNAIIWRRFTHVIIKLMYIFVDGSSNNTIYIVMYWLYNALQLAGLLVHFRA